MNNKEELLKSIQEEEQRAKASLEKLEKMRKQLEELVKEVNVSATGVVLYSDNVPYPNWGICGDNDINENMFSVYTKTNSIFVKKTQAEQEALRREIQEFIRRFAMLNNSNNDWRKNYEEKSEICYDFANKKLNIAILDSYTSFGTICFDTEELAEKCIVELNKKYTPEQIKTGFGVI